MEELISLISQFNDVLKKQISLYLEFIPILNDEEESIAKYDLAALEKAIILKDQSSRIAQSLEDKRLNILKKICYMIAFDPRGQNLSLKLFKYTFSVYLNNIKTLINSEIYEKLIEKENEFIGISNEFEKTFSEVYPRIFRNQTLLKKLMKNVTLSLSLFQSEAEVGMNYDSMGKAQQHLNQGNAVSSVRVKA